MDDEAAEQPHHLLHGHMRVIEQSPVLMKGKLVDEAFAGHHGLLADAGYAVHLDRQLQAMPVYARGLGQMILEDDPDMIAFIRLDGWTRRASIKAPQVESPAWYDHLLYRLCDQMEDLDAVVHGERQIANIRRQDR